MLSAPNLRNLNTSPAAFSFQSLVIGDDIVPKSMNDQTTRNHLPLIAGVLSVVIAILCALSIFTWRRHKKQDPQELPFINPFTSNSSILLQRLLNCKSVNGADIKRQWTLSLVNIAEVRMIPLSKLRSRVVGMPAPSTSTQPDSVEISQNVVEDPRPLRIVQTHIYEENSGLQMMAV